MFMLLLLTGHMPLRGEPSPGANQRISGSVNMAGMSGATGGIKYAMEGPILMYIYKLLCIDRPFTYLIFDVFIGVGGGLQNSESFSSFAGDPSKLSDQELDCLKEAFSLFDADHDGEITINELGRVMRNHGLNPTDDELRGISQIYCHYRRDVPLVITL